MLTEEEVAKAMERLQRERLAEERLAKALEQQRQEERLAKVEKELAATRKELADLRAELAAGLTTRQVRIVDEAGEVRVILDAKADVGGPGLVLYDEAGKPRALLGVNAGGPGLVLKDAAGQTRAWLTDSGSGPWLALFDAAGNTRAILDVDELDEDKPELVLTDAAGKAIWSAP